MNTTMRVIFDWVVFTLIAVLTHSVYLLPYFIVSALLLFSWFVAYLISLFVRGFRLGAMEKKNHPVSVDSVKPASTESIVKLPEFDPGNVRVKRRLLRSVVLYDPDGVRVRVPANAVVSCLSAALGDDEAMVRWPRAGKPELSGWVDVCALSQPKKSP